MNGGQTVSQAGGCNGPTAQRLLLLFAQNTVLSRGTWSLFSGTSLLQSVTQASTLTPARVSPPPSVSQGGGHGVPWVGDGHRPGLEGHRSL